MTGPLDYTDKERDQQKVLAYILDCAMDGNWVSQREMSGDVMSKPPLYNWLGAAGVLALGGPSRLAVAWPSLLAGLGATLLLFYIGRKYLGDVVAFWAAVFYILSNTTYRQLAMVRTDTLFTFFILLGAWMAFEAWRTGKAGPMLGFWLAALASTLTKGPLGLMLSAAGLAAAWRKPRLADSDTPDNFRLRALLLHPANMIGFLLCVALCGGWFMLAWHTVGDAFVARLIGRELIGHAVGGQGGNRDFDFYIPLAWILTRFLPWSIPALYGAWLMWRKPPADQCQRAFERFLMAQFLIGLVIFSLATHKRVELYYPLLPAVALAAGRGMAAFRWAQNPKALWPVAIALALVTVCTQAAFEHGGRGTKPENAQMAEMAEFAREIQATYDGHFPFTYCGAPYALQFQLGTHWSGVSIEQATALLQGNAATFVLAPTAQLLQVGIPEGVHVVRTLDAGGQPFVSILSNRDTLGTHDDMATLVDGLSLNLHHARIHLAGNGRFLLEATAPDSFVEVVNVSAVPARVNMELRSTSGVALLKSSLAPGERKLLTADS